MRIICKKSNLVKGVSIVSKAVPSKTTMPILECILIDATTDVIKLTANDMELGIETTIDGIIDSRGIIALNAKIFSEIVRKLPDNDVVIETESDNQAIITCEKAKFNIAAQSGDDFSYLPAIEREDFITISEFTLKEVVRQTIFSIADNDTNKMMTGELFEIDNDVLRVVSLDGHRISIRKIELKDAYQPRKVIVPGKTLQEISKIIGGEADAEVEISFTKNHIVFEFDRTLVVSRLIEGEYFRIDQMLSSDYETRVHVNKKELLDCSRVQRIAGFSRRTAKKLLFRHGGALGLRRGDDDEARYPDCRRDSVGGRFPVPGKVRKAHGGAAFRRYHGYFGQPLH